MNKELVEKKYTLLEIIPYYLTGKKIKRDCWQEVDYIMFNKKFKPKIINHDTLGKIFMPYSSSCRIKLKEQQEQDNIKNIMLDKYETYYSSPLESLEKFGCNLDKLWLIVS
jgi:hypothetical protein